MTYRVGISGSGFGVKAHLPAFTAHPSFEVLALASPSSAAAIAKERKVPHAFSSCREMVEACELDVVSVASPPFAHLDDVLASLAAHKHVICEKPFALNVRDAETMVHAAREAGTAAAIMHEFRYVAEIVALKELVDNGHLDPLREIEITQLVAWLASTSQRSDSWWFHRARGGGITGALLSHWIDLANWLAKREPMRISGFERTALPTRESAESAFTSDVADGAFALLDYGDGLVARLTADGTVAIDSFTCALHGDGRTAVTSGSNVGEMRLFAVDANETSELEVKPSAYERFGAVQGNVPYIMSLLDDFVLRIEGQASGAPTFEDALVTQRVLASIGFDVTASP